MLLERFKFERTTLTLWVAACIILFIICRVIIGSARLRKIPGPWTFAATRYRLAYEGWNAHSVQTVHKLHLEYGPAVRIGPNEVSFNTLSALKTIYGAGSGFERTSYYRMFDVYGYPNLFSFSSGKQHRDRKRLISHIYTNQTILGPTFSPMIMANVAKLISLIENRKGPCEIFTCLHYFSFDTISEFVYGSNYGATKAMSGSKQSQDLIEDLLNPTRRRFAWYFIHFPSFTKWLTTRTGLIEKLITALGLIKKPFTFTGVRQHAWKAYYSYKDAPEEAKSEAATSTLIGRLFEIRDQHHLSDSEIASECADHLLAGIDTTSDTLMFLIWTLSLPENKHCQEKLREEVLQVPVNSQGIPTPKDLTHLPYLNAVIRETLRLFAPIPTYEPRSLPVDTVIDGYEIPAGTIVGMSPYSLHRDEKIFPLPLKFIPERWLTPSGTLVPESDMQNRYFWAFSSGARMCIGMHLANAEMLTVAAALFRSFNTTTKQVDVSPAITSRYEVFYDESREGMIEHECWVDFERRKQ